MPVPGDNSSSSLRKYYHGDDEKSSRYHEASQFSTSDIDLFIYGLSASEATEKVGKRLEFSLLIFFFSFV